MAVIGGVAQKVHLFVIDLPQSDAGFVKAYPAETTEAFLDGHVSAFAFFGGVPRSILYDNTKLAVVRVLGAGKRQRTRAFNELTSHYWPPRPCFQFARRLRSRPSGVLGPVLGPPCIRHRRLVTADYDRRAPLDCGRRIVAPVFYPVEAPFCETD